MKTAIAVALLAFSTIQVFAQSLNLLEQSSKRKVDPLLLQSILTKERFPEQAVTAIEYHAAGTRAAQQAGDMVGVLIEATGDVAEQVRSLGGIVGSKHGNIYTALIPTTAVGSVAQQSAVHYIEASRPLFPSLDLSVPKTGADVLHALPDSLRLTGKGVIIGFTDTGINTDHPNFKTAAGKTRILYVWDQYSSGGGSPPAGFTYGIEKDSAAINAHTWSMFDGGAHGTHVAGIAAGSGLPSKTYVGMAPEADIIMVSNFGDDLFNRGLTTVGTLDGYDYIRGKANDLGKRFVINTSQGTNLGPHDGTSLFEQAISADVAAGGILALAAGNEATSARHASAVVTTSTPQVVNCYVSSGYSIPMDIWYEGNDRLVLRIKEADDVTFEAVFPPVDSTIVFAFDWAMVSVTTKIGSPLNGDNEIFINFRAFSDVTMQLEFSVASGNTLPDGGRVDLWWERNYYVQFLTHVDNSITFGIPAGADSAITVASYNNRASYGAVDDISTFSGRGPRRDGVLKPDISGLGGMVMSSVLSSSYDMFSGTSMSSPHVAGAVALLLQQDSTLTSYAVRQKLITSATEDAFTGPVPNPTWGYGKLNVLKAAGYRGTPLISLDRDTVDFESALVQFTKYDSVRVENLGNGDLTLTAVTPSSGIFSAETTPFSISPHTFGYFSVSVTPSDTGAFTGYLDIATDDSAHPVVRVTLLGRGDYLPLAGVSPDSLEYVVNEGERSSHEVTIANTGQGPLKYGIGIDYPAPPSPGTRPVRTAASSLWGHVSDELSVHSSVKATFAPTPLLPIVVQDPIGDGTSVDISEIRGLTGGGMITLQLVLATTFNPSDFAGYLGLDLDQNPATGMFLPNGAGGQDVGCEFFVDFFGLTSGVDLYDSLGYWRGTYVPELDLPGNKFTFSIPLDVLNQDDGKINIASVLGTNSGPTDWVPDAGHGVVGVSWIAVDPSGGTVPPAGSAPIEVRVSTGDLAAGSYSARLSITTNDTGKAFVTIPVRLTVNPAANLFVADSISFGKIYVGYPDTVAVIVQNNGSSGLTVSGMTVNDPQFTILDPTSFPLAKDQSRMVRIRCNPAGPGVLSGQLTISSNDPDTPVLPVPLTGLAADPPVIALTPADSLTATIDEGDSTVKILTISNTGAGDLYWNIGGDGTMSVPNSIPGIQARTEEQKKAILQSASQNTGKNVGAPSVGSYDLGTLLSLSGQKKILLWTGFSDMSAGGEVENTMNAIKQYVPDASFVQTSTTSVTEFGDLLAASDIFLMPEQEQISDLFSLGASFAQKVSDFVLGGRSMIVLDHGTSGSTTFLRGTNLLDIVVLNSYEFTAVVTDPTSQLVKDVPSTFFAMNGSNYHSSTNGKKIVQELYSGSNMVTQRDLGGGRVIYIGMDFYSYNSEMARLLANAVVSSSGAFVSVSSTSGVVPSNDSRDVEVTLNARNIHAGVYRSSLTVSNNDPLHNPKILPVVLSVAGKPVIQLEPDSITGYTAYVGVPRKDTVRVINAGSELLVVTAIVSSDTSIFKTNKSELFVLPQGEETFVVTTSRSDTGSFGGTIALSSNDAKNPAMSVVLSGHGAHPPVLTTTPDSLVVTINEGDSVSTVLTLGNTGLGELQWEIPQFAESDTAETRVIAAESMSPTTDEKKFGVSDASLVPTGLIKSQEARRSVSSGTAGTVLIWSSMYNAPYWGTLKTILESAGFTVVQSDIRPITPSGSYEAIFTSEPLTPLTPSEVADLKNYIHAGGRVIDIGDSFNENINPLLTEFGVERLYSSVYGPVTSTHKIFQGVGDLNLDGENWDNTLLVALPSVSIATCSGQPIASIGTKDGLLVFGEDSHFSDFVGGLSDPDNIKLLQNVITWIKTGGWLTGSPSSGTIAADGSQGVTVNLNAANLRGGDYFDFITMKNNDPLRNPKKVSVHMEVIGKPFIKLNPDSITGVTAYVGVSRTDTLRVRNTGSSLLVVNAVTSSDTARFKASVPDFYVLPDAEQALAILTEVSDTGEFRGVITFSSNDPKHPSAAFVVSGHSVHPPVLTLAPDSLVVMVNEGDTAKRTVTIGNAGLAALHWKIEGAASDASMAPGHPAGAGSPSPAGLKGAMQAGALIPWGKVSGRSKQPVLSRAGADGPAAASAALLPLVVTDPIGDASSVDVSEIRGMSGGEITIQLVFATPLDPYDMGGSLGFDLDQNVLTGTALPYGISGQDVGCERYVTFFNVSAGVDLFDQFGNYLGIYPTVLDIPGRTMTFSIPLSAMNNDDGVMNIAAVLGNYYGPTDWVPDIGHGTLQSWVFADLTEGVIQPGGTQDVVITMDARKLRGGSYRQIVFMRSDDPLHDPTEMPVALTVVGKPLVSLQPDSIVGATAYVGVQRKDTLHVKNTGSVSLAVSKVTSSDTSKFKVDTTAFNLTAGVTKSLVVITSMQALGPFRGEITVHSNDVKRPEAVFVLAGTVEHPSSIVVAPDSFLVRLDQLDSISRTLTISNTGLGTLNWEVSGASSAGNAIPAGLLRSAEEQAAIRERQAQSTGNNRGVPSVSPYSMKTLLSIPGTRRILLWTGFADTTEGGEVENTMYAIRQYMPDVQFEHTSTTSPSEFASLLNASDIFIMPEQERTGNLSSLGSSFASALGSFVRNGKTMIVLDFFWGYDSVGGMTSAPSGFLNATGLMSVTITSYGGYVPAAVHDPASPLVKDVNPTFISMDGTNYHNSPNGRKIVREQYSQSNIVTLRDVGAGRVIYFGMDFYSYNRDMARLLANAVSSSKGSFLSTLPGSGVIAPGGSQQVTVGFNGKNIPNGTYVSSILIYTNDPLRNPLTVPVTLERTIVGVEDVVALLPAEFALHQNYPNPFNPETRIRYDLPERSFVTLEVYNILGERLMVLANEEQTAGYHTVTWNGRAGAVTASSGVYLVRIQAGEYVKTIKMVLLR